MESQPTISVIVPLYNEEESLRLLISGVREALIGRRWELLLVDDGSRDATAGIAEEVCRSDDRVRLLRLARNYGQTAAMQAGFDHARGDVIASMDGDLQYDPWDIPQLIEKLDEGYDLVAGYRENRQDKALRRKVPSWIANRLIRWITGVNIRDTGCSLRAYRADIVQRLVIYSDMHRFIPAIAAATGGARIAEIPVRHHPRRYGRSKYGLSRAWRVLLDILTIAMIRSFRDRPLHMFGLAAFAALELAIALAAATMVAATFRFVKASALVLPSAAVIMFGLATYLLMLGLIGEILVRQYWRSDPGTLPVLREVGR